MLLVKRFIVWAIEALDTLLDKVPTYEDGKFYRYGFWGCRLQLAGRAFHLEEKWGLLDTKD